MKAFGLPTTVNFPSREPQPKRPLDDFYHIYIHIRETYFDFNLNYENKKSSTRNHRINQNQFKIRYYWDEW